MLNRPIRHPANRTIALVSSPYVERNGIQGVWFFIRVGETPREIEENRDGNVTRSRVAVLREYDIFLILLMALVCRGGWEWQTFACVGKVTMFLTIERMRGKCEYFPMIQL